VHASSAPTVAVSCATNASRATASFSVAKTSSGLFFIVYSQFIMPLTNKECEVLKCSDGQKLTKKLPTKSLTKKF